MMTYLKPAKKIVLAFSLALLTFALAAQQPAPANRKVIKNPTEYNAYITAMNTQDAAARAAAMEAFTRQYPHSVVYTDALEQEMAAWQQVGNTANILESARLLLKADPGNVRALAIVVALDRAGATGGDKAALDELCPYTTAGMREVSQWQKPDGMTDADFAQLSKQMEDIFYGAAGFCALQQKNYSQARDFYSRAFADDAASLQDVYQLAVADLEMTPLDANGFWYCARAIHLADKAGNAAASNGIAPYCLSRYKRYHGSTGGWDALLAASATQDALPPNFAAGITPAPPPAVPPAK